MSRLLETFAAARAEGRAVLIGYLPAGFPTVTDSIALMATMVENGVDIIEVGLPYSDPLMDGPVIQAATSRALAGGCTTDKVLKVVEGVAATGAPTLVMSYWNPIEQFGPAHFAKELAAVGGAGTITPDLTVEEAGDWVTATDEHALDRVFLAAPSSTRKRLEAVAGVANGFVYAASTMGVTGTRDTLSGEARDLVSRIRAVTDTPVAVGVGVSNAEQAHEVAGYADGVIVGSAFIRAVQQSSDPQAAARDLGALAAELATAVRRNGRVERR